MSDEYKAQLTLCLPPSEQFAKGNMLNLRANTARELQELVVEAKRQPDLAPFFGGSAPAASTAGSTPADPSPASAEPETDASGPQSQDSSSTSEESVSETDALANAEKYLGKGQEAASEGMVAAAAKKSGRPADEIRVLPKADVLAIIKGGK